MKLKIWPPGKEMWTCQQENGFRVTAASLTQYTGVSHSSHLDCFYRLTLNDDGGLTISCPTLPDQVIEPEGKDYFFYKDPRRNVKNMFVSFTRDKKGKVDGFYIRHVRMPHHRFDKVTVSEATAK